MIRIEELKKGDRLEIEDIELLSGSSRKSEHFWSEVLKLKNHIEDTLESIGLPVTIKQHQGGLVLLTDSEAIGYNSKRFSQGLRSSAFAHRRTMLIDVEQLTEKEKLQHSKQLEVQGRILESARREQKNLLKESKLRRMLLE